MKRSTREKKNLKHKIDASGKERSGMERDDTRDCRFFTISLVFFTFSTVDMYTFIKIKLQ